MTAREALARLRAGMARYGISAAGTLGVPLPRRFNASADAKSPEYRELRKLVK